VATASTWCGSGAHPSLSACPFPVETGPNLAIDGTATSFTDSWITFTDFSGPNHNEWLEVDLNGDQDVSQVAFNASIVELMPLQKLIEYKLWWGVVGWIL